MTDVMGREDDIKATPATELKQMLDCIFDRQELEAVRGRVEQRELAMAESFLAASGIDTESFLDKAVLTVRSSATAVDSGSEGAPLSQEAFDALDEGELVTYLEAQGIDVPQVVDNMMLRVDEHAQFATVNDEQSLRDDPPVVQTVGRDSTGKRLGTFLTSLISMAVGAGQLRPAVFASVVVGTVAVGIGIGVYGLSPLQQDGLNNATTPVRLTQSIPSDRLALAMVAGETNYPGEWGAGQSAIPSVTADSQITVPVMLTEARGMDTMSLVKTAAANSATVDTVEREFVFVKGDTLWHGMRKHGVPEALQAKLTKKINVVFHPGDRVVFNFVDGEFNGLEILLGNQDKITITKDLSLVATHISRTDIQTVVGTVKHSLHGALARKLNDQAAWRVATRMKHLGVPVNTLQSGAQFEVRIERRTVPGGEVVGYGEIKYLRLDAGKQGTFFFDSERLGVANQPKVLS